MLVLMLECWFPGNIIFVGGAGVIEESLSGLGLLFVLPESSWPHLWKCILSEGLLPSN